MALDERGDEEGGASDWTINWWRYCTDKDVDEKTTQEHSRGLAQYHIDRFDVVPFTANHIIDRLTPRTSS